MTLGPEYEGRHHGGYPDSEDSAAGYPPASVARGGQGSDTVRIDEARRRYLDNAAPPQHAQDRPLPPPTDEFDDFTPPGRRAPHEQRRIPGEYLHDDQHADMGFDGLNPADGRPTRGWRKFFAPFGMGRGQEEIDYEKMISGIRVGLRNPRIIGVMSGRGGVGKTSTAYMLGSTIAEHRNFASTAIISIDHNGSLARRAIDVSSAAGKDPNPSSIVRFARDPNMVRMADIDSHLLKTESGLKVLGSSHDTGDAPVTPKDYRRAVEQLQMSNQVILVDFGNTPDSPVYEMALNSLDALVMVMATEQDSVVSGVGLLDDIFDGSVYGLGAKLRSRTMVLLNQRSSDRPRMKTDFAIGRIAKTIGETRDGTAPIVPIPWDAHLAASGKIDPELTSKKMRAQFVEAASIIMGMLPVT